MNNVQQIGNLVKNVELKKARNGGDVARLRIAVNRGKRDGVDLGVDYFNVTVFNGQARACYEYLEKGSKVAVTGRLSSSSYVSRKTGAKMERIEIVADRVEFLSHRKSDGDEEEILLGEPDMADALIEVEDEELPFDTVAEDTE
ncbi:MULTISPECIES: single-stranded DNA-binding protein [Clostridia]|uniref:single-stranded DNA-binding protein n=1 Tax=Clostridia TaxID=186801 RepID=UPI0025C0B7BB|nr:single-stranded DNA-binding protein [Blautia sp.]